MINSLIRDLERQKEDLIIEEIEQLVISGILRLETSSPKLVQEAETGKIRYIQSVKLVSKEAELLAKLRKENEELKKALHNIHCMLSEIGKDI